MPTSHRLSHPVDMDAASGFGAYKSKFCVAVSETYRRVMKSNAPPYARLQLPEEHIDPSFAKPSDHSENTGAVWWASQPFGSPVRSKHQPPGAPKTTAMLRSRFDSFEHRISQYETGTPKDWDSQWDRAAFNDWASLYISARNLDQESQSDSYTR